MALRAAPVESLATEAYVTLATNDSYALGALVLAHSLRKAGTARHLVCLVTSRGMSEERRAHLDDVFDVVVVVDELDSQDARRLRLLQRPELGVTFTKLHAWTLVQYSKCVFLDADTLVLRSVEDLFERNVAFAAAPDTGWPDCFNSGVFLFTPSLETHAELLALADTAGSFDGGDQGILNDYFSNWQSGAGRLPFVFNMTANASYGYAPAFERYRDTIRVLHFIGSHKPWHGMPSGGGSGAHAITGLFVRWWQVHDDFVQCNSESAPYRSVIGAHVLRAPGVGTVSGAPPPSPGRSVPGIGQPFTGAPQDGSWTDAPDAYLRSGSFAEIQARLDDMIHAPTTQAPSRPARPSAGDSSEPGAASAVGVGEETKGEAPDE